MKTLEFIKLNESGANNVVASLQQLLADFKYITPTSAVSTGISKGMTSSYFTANSKRCMMTLPKKWTKSQSES